jgi:hypothetical protein
VFQLVFCERITSGYPDTDVSAVAVAVMPRISQVLAAQLQQQRTLQKHLIYLSLLFIYNIKPTLSLMFQLVTLPFCPESPKFLLLDRDNKELSRNTFITFPVFTSIL